MDITINGSQTPDLGGRDVTTLRDALGSVYAWAEASGLVISEIVMNGQVLNGADEERLAELAADHVKTIAVTAMPFGAFLTEHGARLRTTLEQLEADSAQATASFTAGRVREAAAQFRAVGDGAKQAVDSIGVMNSSLLYLSHRVGQGGSRSTDPVDPRVPSCTAALRSAADAMAAQDVDRFTATMRGEWAALIADWKRELQSRMVTTDVELGRRIMEASPDPAQAPEL